MAVVIIIVGEIALDSESIYIIYASQIGSVGTLAAAQMKRR